MAEKHSLFTTVCMVGILITIIIALFNVINAINNSVAKTKSTYNLQSSNKSEFPIDIKDNTIGTGAKNGNLEYFISIEKNGSFTNVEIDKSVTKLVYDDKNKLIASKDKDDLTFELHIPKNYNIKDYGTISQESSSAFVPFIVPMAY
jgi:hypothetical protein